MSVNEKNKSNSLLYDISIRIKNLRKAKGLTQKQLGEYLGVDKNTVWGYENDISFPSYEVLIRISSVFNVSTDELLGVEPIDYKNLHQDCLNIKGISPKRKQILIDLIKEWEE